MNPFFRFLRSIILFFQYLFSQANKDFLQRSLVSAFQNIVRNPVISFSSVLILSLILILFHASIAVQFFAEESINSINRKLDVIVEVKDGIDVYVLGDLMESVKKIPGTEKVKFVDKKEALDSFLERHANIRSFLSKYQLGNPLPSYLEIATQNPEQIQKVIKLLQDARYNLLIAQTKVASDVDQQDRIEKLIHLGSFVRTMNAVLLFVFILVSVLVTFNTINIAVHQRKDEIHIMQLVGATSATIRAPYVFEGLLYSVAALALASLVNVMLYFYILAVVKMSFAGSSFLIGAQNMLTQFFQSFPQTILLEAGLLLGCSLLASFAAIEVYLRRHRA